MWVNGVLRTQCLFHADEAEAVAFGEDELLDAGVGRHVVVELADGLGLRVVVVGRVDDVTVPEHIVGQNDGTGMEIGEEKLVVVRVLTFIGVDKGHVDAQVHGGKELEDVAHNHFHTCVVGGLLKPGTRETFLFVVDLEGVDGAAFRHTRCHGEGGIARIGADFHHRPGLEHLHEHAQELSLKMARRHAWTEQMEMGGAVEALEVGVGGGGMAEDV